MKVKALSILILILMTAVIIVPVVLAPAGQISGPGTPDGSQGTNFLVSR